MITSIQKKLHPENQIRMAIFVFSKTYPSTQLNPIIADQWCCRLGKQGQFVILTWEHNIVLSYRFSNLLSIGITYLLSFETFQKVKPNTIGIYDGKQYPIFILPNKNSLKPSNHFSLTAHVTYGCQRHAPTKSSNFSLHTHI